MFWTVLGYMVVALAAGKLLLWLFLYLMGDAREIFKHKKSNRRYRPKLSVVVVAEESEAHLLDVCVRSVFANTLRPNEVIVAAAGKAYGTAVYMRRRYKYKNLRVFKSTGWQAIFNKHARGSIGVVFYAGTRLDKSALVSGASYFRDRKFKVLSAAAVTKPDDSILRGIMGIQQLVQMHVKRVLPQKNATLSQNILFFRSKSLNELSLIKIAHTTEVYAHQSVKNPLNQLFLRQNSIFTILPTFIEPAAAGVLLQAYGVERGLFMLYFAAAFMWLLAGIAILNYRGISLVDRLSLFLLAPFAYMAYLANSLYSLTYMSWKTSMRAPKLLRRSARSS